MSEVAKRSLALLSTIAAVVPVPYLSQACHLLTELFDLVQHVRGIRSRMTNLAVCLDILIVRLLEKFQPTTPGWKLLPDTEAALKKFLALMVRVRDTTKQFSEKGFFGILLMRTDAHSIIRNYHGEIMATAAAFHVVDVHLSNQHLILSHEDARKNDHQEIMDHIESLEHNQEKLIEEIHEANLRSLEPMSPAHLHKKLKQCPEYHPEREFLQDVLHNVPPPYSPAEPLAFPLPVIPTSSDVLPCPSPPPAEASSHTSTSPVTDVTYAKILVNEPAAMSAEPEDPASNTAIIPPPSPTYTEHLLEPGRRTKEFDFVRQAVQAWEWSTPEAVAEDSFRMPVAQIIF